MSKKPDILGIGLDNDDGHKRITQADNFCVVGGKQETHDRIAETLIKTQEDLSRRGKTFRDASRDEIEELLNKHDPA